MAFRIVQLLDAAGRNCWLNPLQVQGVTDDGHGQTVIEFVNGERWIVKDAGQQVAILLENAVRDPTWVPEV